MHQLALVRRIHCTALRAVQQLALVVFLYSFHYGFVCCLVMFGMSISGLSFVRSIVAGVLRPATCIFDSSARTWPRSGLSLP